MKIMTTTLGVAALTVMAVFAEKGSESAFDKDREAILKMVGEFEVGFYFKETVGLKDGYELKPDAYTSKAKEKVIVVKDTGKEIELQHLLMVKDHVVKHWSQIWKYEDTELLEFQGHKTWKARTISPEEAKGTWTQVVTQTTDQPRYESFGTWQHEADNSTWTSGVTNRPLPRREYTKRKDYDIVKATNRQTITPKGWVHEQDNVKFVSRDGVQESLCREVGFNTYDRIEGADFTVVNEFWEENGEFWMAAKEAWGKLTEGKKQYTLLKKTDEGSIRFMMGEKEEEQVNDADKLVEALTPYFTAVK
jgi:hypothetical protein